MYSVMIVDDSPTELVLVQKALEKEYRVIPQEGGKAAIEYLAKTTQLPSVILLDVDMPVMNGFEVFSALISNPKTANIPTIFVTGNQDVATELEAYNLGAVDFIRKPYVAEILLKKVGLHIEIIESKKKLQERYNNLQDFNEQLQDFNDQIQESVNEQTQKVHSLEYFLVWLVTDLITKKEPYSGVHSIRVTKFMEILLRQMAGMRLISISPDDVELILLASQLHDMGKIGVPDEVLTKVGKYTPEEFEKMKSHTVLAADTIQKFAYLLPDNNFVSYLYQMARSHHEQWCGKGYPDGLAGNNIPQLARILAVCDVYEALVAERSYKNSFTHEQAVQIINQGIGVQFDPQVVAAFNRVAGEMAEVAKAEIKP